MKTNINGMHLMIFCWAGSIPGEGGVMLVCQSWAAPIRRGHKLNGISNPGMMNKVSGWERSLVQRKLAPLNSIALKHGIKAKEHGKLQKDGQATPQRADFVFPHKLHELAVHFLRVFLVFVLDSLHLGLESRHALHGPRARLSQRPE